MLREIKKSVDDQIRLHVRDFAAPVIVCRERDGVLAYVCERMAELLDFEQSDLIGAHRHKIMVNHTDFYSEETRTQLRTKNNGQAEVFFHNEFQDFDNERYAVGTVTDFHLLNESTKHLLEDYMEFSKKYSPRIISGFNDVEILDLLPIGVACLALCDDPFFVYVNEHFCKGMGYTCQDLLSGRVKSADISVDQIRMSQVVSPIGDFDNSLNGFYHHKQWRHKAGHIVEGRVLTTKVAFSTDGGDSKAPWGWKPPAQYALSVISFRRGNAYQFAKTPAAIKRAAELLGQSPENVIEVCETLQREGFLQFPD
jgi:PAS domain-containing protein